MGQDFRRIDEKWLIIESLIGELYESNLRNASCGIDVIGWESMDEIGNFGQEVD